MPALWPHFDCHLAEDGLVTPIHHCQKAGKNSRWNFNIHNMHWKYENKSLPSCSSGLPGCAIMAHLDIGSFWTLLLAPNHPYIQDEHLTWVYSIKSWFFTFLYIKKKKINFFPRFTFPATRHWHDNQEIQAMSIRQKIFSEIQNYFIPINKALE